MKKVIVDIMSVFSASIKENIHVMFEQAENQVDDYKEAFKGSFKWNQGCSYRK